ncbi:MAG: hypothetical protein NC308_09775, partial [Clostridium sp.]|nr:hypothetical protein [Clostridium sp.]
NGVLLKKIDFNTGYYNSSSNNALSRRLRLESIKENDGKEWIFTYAPGNLPPKNSVEDIITGTGTIWKICLEMMLYRLRI